MSKGVSQPVSSLIGIVFPINVKHSTPSKECLRQ